MSGFFIMSIPNFTYDFLEEFPGDKSFNNFPRQTPGMLYALVEPAEFPHVELIHFNDKLGENLGITKDETNFLAAQHLDSNIKTYASAYAGHQFGNWAGQLGDGRAIYIGECITKNHKRQELQYKGSGVTPYSRHADGRAVFRSSLREYLMSEAIHYLGIPSSRALSLCKTGEKVVRDMFYNGNPRPENGAIIIRSAESFLRFGHFEWLAAQGDDALLKRLIDYCIIRYFPEIKDTSPHRYLTWFQKICDATADMIVEWYRVGFVHGVMNTDNMSVLGLTIDYGPFSMMDEYNLQFTSNTTDLPGRRYAFGNQANIAHWNLIQLANAIFPIVNNKEGLEDILTLYADLFWNRYDKMMGEKLGLDFIKNTDAPLLLEWQKMMDKLQPDYTLFFQLLETVEETSILKHFESCLYHTLSQEEEKHLVNFIQKYLKRRNENTISISEAKAKMSKANPRFILRNYLLYQCIEKADQGDFTMLNQLFDALQHPYENLYPEFNQKRPNWADEKPGCSCLSCSS